MRETSRNGPGPVHVLGDDHYRERYDERYERSHEWIARVVAYMGPYIFWAMIGATVAGVIVVRGLGS